MRIILFGSLLVASVPLFAGTTNVRFEQYNSLFACHSARTSYDVAFRKQPLGFVNEGSSTAFISCAFPIDGPGASIDGPGASPAKGLVSPSAFRLGVLAQNIGDTSQTMTCTVVDDRFETRYITKSAVIPAGESMTISWDREADNAGEYFILPSLSCAVPAGVRFKHISRMSTYEPI